MASGVSGDVIAAGPIVATLAGMGKGGNPTIRRKRRLVLCERVAQDDPGCVEKAVTLPRLVQARLQNEE